ncbi:LysR substrate-binding domain-containing protein [Nitratireductor soli]|uniref:LysR substrate-binding domain-containing protein n=1 Tax=Nitratireductor soli TaxID=1670619 RepID=UPI0019D0B576|nr:LysR substrate-binding domain-containing protein [Nitratireductor soli]
MSFWVRARDATPRFTLSTSVSFASKWFAPRLHRLMARLPDVDIQLEVSDVNVDLTDGRVDAALRYGTGTYPGTVSARILDETMSPVCSPDYRAHMDGLSAPVDLTRCTLLNESRVLHDDSALPNWERWFAAAGVAGARSRGPTLSHGSLTIEAALRGEGIALGRSILVAEDIAAGRLVEPFPQIRLPVGRRYDLVHRPGEKDDPRIAALRDWLKEEVRTFLTATASAPSGTDRDHRQAGAAVVLPRAQGKCRNNTRPMGIKSTRACCSCEWGGERRDRALFVIAVYSWSDSHARPDARFLPRDIRMHDCTHR